jgi:hypothetical protein
MSENLIQAVSDAVSQVAQLPIEQQPAAFGKIREVLEAELNSNGLANSLDAASALAVISESTSAAANSQLGN